MISYPIISFPSSLTEHIDTEAYLLEIYNNHPKAPIKPTREKTYEGCLIGFVFYVISAIIFSGVLSLSTSIPIGLVIAIVLWIIFSSTSQVEYHERLKSYEIDYAKYRFDKLQYDHLIARVRLELEYSILKGDDNWKIRLIKKRLAEYKFNLSQGYGKRGASEEFFLNHLKKFFDCKAYRNPSIHCNNGDIYNPDIVLLFSDINLALAIEIDEPYTLKDGTPIHYYSLENGFSFFSHEEPYLRNSRSIFSSRTDEIIREGFIQIRFAEEQVVLQADSCCKYLVDRIKSRLRFNISKKNLDNIIQLKRVPGWTFKEAQDMYKKRYREIYLDKIDYEFGTDDLPI